MKNFKFKKSLLALMIGMSTGTVAAENQTSDAGKEMEVISVKGLKGSILRSVNNKRFSSTIVDGISSEDLGKFPDQNVAESLQRITGISIDRSGGEGRYITVRGFGPEFNAVLYNNRVLATENAGREFSFDVLASEAIGGADAYKAGSAELITGGIGATINLRTAKPMDHMGTRSAFSAKATHDTLSGETYPAYSGVYSFANDQFGVLLSATYVERKYRVDNAGTGGWMKRDLVNDFTVNQLQGDSDFTQLYIPRNMDFYTDRGSRDRLGGNVVIQSRPTDNVEMTFDILYSKFDVKSNVITSANWTHDWASDAFDTVIGDSNNTLLAYSYKDTLEFASDFVQQEYSRPTETRQIGFNTKWYVTNDLSFEFDASYSDAINDNRGNGKFVIAGDPTSNPRYDYTNGGNYPSITLDRGISADKLRSHQTWFSGNLDDDSILQYSLNGNYSLDSDIFTKLTFGVYSSSRTKGGSSTGTVEGGMFAGYGYDVPDDLFKAVNQSDFLDGGAPSTWFTFDSYDYAAYLWSEDFLNENFGTLAEYDGVYTAEAEKRRRLDQLKRAGNPFPSPNRTSQRSVSEDTLETFVKVDISTDLMDMPLSGNFGIRYAQTDVYSTGFTSLLTDITQNPGDPTLLDLKFTDPQQMTVTNDYSNVLPSLNLKLDLSSEQILRFAASKTISRPTLTRLGVGLGGYNGRLNASTASGGNPMLVPFESTNFDLSWEWYYNDASYMSVAGFIKQADNFLAQATNNENLLPGNEFGTFQVTRTSNTEKANVTGVEFALLHTFDSGFGTQANYTIVNSDDDFDALTNPDVFAVEGLSNTANLIGFYEDESLQLRIAYNWRDEYLSRAKGRQSQAEMVEAYGQIDLSASYQLDENFEVFAEGVNITNEKTRSFSIYKERLLDYQETGARFSVGVRGSF